MPRPKTRTDEQLAENHRRCSEKYRKANMAKYRDYSRAYYANNKVKITARRKELREIKKEKTRLARLAERQIIQKQMKNMLKQLKTKY